MLTCLSLLFAAALSAQLSAQTVDLGPMSAAERVAAREPIRVEQRALPKTGIHRRLTGSLSSNGRLRSAGAQALRLHVTGFNAADGTLWIRGANQPASEAVAYRGLGPNEDGEFWSHTVHGEELIVDFQPGPSGAALRWSVPEVTHAFGLQGYRTEEEIARELRCSLDINCHAEWNESAQSVAMFYFEIPEGQSACSGALVRTKSGSGVPYFLTAHHCVSSEQIARTVETFWNYQTSTCNGKAPDLRNAVRAPSTGSRYVVSQDTTKGDFAMILLNSVPSVARFADFDASELPLGQAIASISHPLGSWKRAAFGTVFVNYWDFSGADFPPQHYYQVLLTKGATHPGSSGSPLFSKPNTVAGMLSHGPFFSEVDICAQDPKVDGYAKLSLAWPHFQKYLDDPAPTSLTVSPAQVTLTVRNGQLATNRQTVVVNSTSAEPVPVTISSSDAWVRVLRAQGTAKTGAPFSTEIEFRPGFFQNRSGLIRSSLEVVSGNNGRVVPIDADVIVLPSDVLLQAKAVAVESNDDCRYRLDLNLTERGGVATNLTALRIDGEDYTDRLAQWFGATELTAKGSLKTSLKVCRPGRIDSYQITIAGRDAGSNRAWSNSTLVDFN